jgi:hypothetical protein
MQGNGWLARSSGLEELAVHFRYQEEIPVQESSISLGPRWVRVSFACFAFAVSGWMMWREFFRFHWVMMLCVGLAALTMVPRKVGEAPGTYYSEPRNVVTLVLVIAVLVSAVYNLSTR